MKFKTKQLNWINIFSLFSLIFLFLYFTVVISMTTRTINPKEKKYPTLFDIVVVIVDVFRYVILRFLQDAYSTLILIYII